MLSRITMLVILMQVLSFAATINLCPLAEGNQWTYLGRGFCSADWHTSTYIIDSVRAGNQDSIEVYFSIYRQSYGQLDSNSYSFVIDTISDTIIPAYQQFLPIWGFYNGYLKANISNCNKSFYNGDSLYSYQPPDQATYGNCGISFLLSLNFTYIENIGLVKGTWVNSGTTLDSLIMFNGEEIVGIENGTAVPPLSCSFDAYPNPFRESLNISIPYEDTWAIAIFDIQGKRSFQQISNYGIGQFGFNPIQMPNGIYIITATNGKEQYSKQLLHLK